MISSHQISLAPFSIGIILFFAAGAVAQTTNGVSAAEIQGRQLAAQILEQRPDTDSTNIGVLETHNSREGRINIPIHFEIHAPESSTAAWSCIYQTLVTNGEKLVVTHPPGRGPNQYTLFENDAAQKLAGNETMVPFAGSDFWVADLGLAFFHWPSQEVLKHETRRTRACVVLESTNPDPGPGAYSRVDCWVDDETLGIVHAEAFDAGGKLLKEFDPKSFKRVNGHLKLQDMEIRNVQTQSRTWIKFNLDIQ